MSMFRFCAVQKRGVSTSEFLNRCVKERFFTRLVKSAEKDRAPVASLQLRELDDRFLFLRPGRLVVDFGCSPGRINETVIIIVVVEELS